MLVFQCNYGIHTLISSISQHSAPSMIGHACGLPTECKLLFEILKGYLKICKDKAFLSYLVIHQRNRIKNEAMPWPFLFRDLLLLRRVLLLQNSVFNRFCDNELENLFHLTRTTYPIILKNLGISSAGLSSTVAFWLSALMYLYKNY